ALNQLVETKRGPPGFQIILGRYDYNALGLRVRHRISERGDVDYYYDDMAVIEERNASNGALLAHYRYADRLISLDIGGATQYYHHDALGSTVNLTTDLATVQVSYKLDPWGRIREQIGASVNRQIFTGQEHDENTGLIYFGARYYDPDTARFITQDTYLGQSNTPPSLHRYLYAYSNPTVYIDLFGNMTEEQLLDYEADGLYWAVKLTRAYQAQHKKEVPPELFARYAVLDNLITLPGFFTLESVSGLRDYILMEYNTNQKRGAFLEKHGYHANHIFELMRRPLSISISEEKFNDPEFMAAWIDYGEIDPTYGLTTGMSSEEWNAFISETIELYDFFDQSIDPQERAIRGGR
ncbi:MAG: RHS repeat-associated core domain-containing protein, partial [Planctomycetes bacterium]|nr:RHS repeat-associated core domain-containing protein [Planctomycetota bacterium]